MRLPLKTSLVAACALVALMSGFVASPAGAALIVHHTLANPDQQADAQFGSSVALGDVDGDGKADIAVGAPLHHIGATADVGQVRIFSGDTGLHLRPLDYPTIEESLVHFGAALAMADLTAGDSFADVAVGAPLANVGGLNRGSVAVFNGATGAFIRTLTGDTEDNAEFGTAVAMADLTGDGEADVVVGAPRKDGSFADQGRVHVFNGLTGAAICTLDPPAGEAELSARFGASLAMGDVTGDATADIAVGAPFRDGTFADQGRVYVFNGATCDPNPVRTLDPPVGQAEADARFGASLAMGDVTSDGNADVTVGAPKKNGTFVDQGRAYVFNGASGGFLSPALDMIVPQPGAEFGTAVAMGDTNEDGFADVAVGAPLEDIGGAGDQGRAYLFSGVDRSPLQALDRPGTAQAGARFAAAVAIGAYKSQKPLVAVGAALEDGAGADEGRAYVFSGAAEVFFLREPQGTNPDAFGQYGAAVSLADVDGDGKVDVLVGAPAEDAGGFEDQGRVYVFSGATGTLLLTLEKPGTAQAGARFGAALATGDTQGDARLEILVGAPSESGTFTGQGKAYLFSSTGGHLTTYVGNLPEQDGKFGAAVAVGDIVVGDPNAGDKAEAVVGAPFEGADDRGRIYTFRAAGGLIGYGKAGTTEYTGLLPAGAHYGASLAVADVDADSAADIVAGAPGEDLGGRTDEGRLYVDSTAISKPGIGDPGAEFGYSVALGDVVPDSSKKQHIAVGAPGEDVVTDGDDRGRAYVLSGGGNLLYPALASPGGGGRFGQSVAVGEANGEFEPTTTFGRADVAVGAPLEAEGRAYVFSGPSGTLLSAFDSPNQIVIGRFGAAVALAGADFAAGAPLEEDDVGSEGRAYVFTYDIDRDGCTGEREVGLDQMTGGRRNPKYIWDFFDTPVGVPPSRDRVVAGGDIGAVVARFGTTDDNNHDGIPDKPVNRNTDPLSAPPPSGYHPAFDRGNGVIPGGDIWDSLPPDGNISGGDIGAVVAQFGHNCL